MNKQTILIFGAGLNQLTLIQAARDLGLKTIVVDPNPDAPGKPLADVFYPVGGEDYTTTRDIAIRHRVGGIVTSQMENPMRLMARLAEELGFIFHSREVTERSLDKWLMKQAFLAHGVPCAKGILLTDDQNLPIDRIQSMGFPLIIKPRDASSSQGVVRVDSLEDLAAYLPVSRRYSKVGQVVLEEFLRGPEYSVEGITFRGESKVVQITEKFVTPFPHTVEMGHLQPASLSPVEKQAVEECVLAAIQAIGIDNSASHTEIKVMAGRGRVIEIGARLGGDFISSYLVKSSRGVDMDRAAVQVALGQRPDLGKTKDQYACIRYLQLPVGGKVTGVKEWRQILAEPPVVFAHISVEAGETIPEITESKKRPGFVVVQGNSREEVLNAAEKYLETLAGRIQIVRQEESTIQQ